MRTIAADGTIAIAAGSGTALRILDAAPVPATAYKAARADAIALDPAGTPYWSTARIHQIHRLRADGQVELVAGVGTKASQGADGPVGPARLAALNAPKGLAFGPDGALYFCDSANTRIRKVTGLGAGETPMIVDSCGKSAVETIGALVGGADAGGGTVTTICGPGGRYFSDPMADDALVLPLALTVDAQNRLVLMDAGANLIRFCPL